ncbi:phosphatidylinositol-glycan biosynthesis class X protein [Octopus vulgaris]|uniref:Phosphatidylinositol-glycan biosynthesis class X protein n=2 Tax=Octopus TaxID=6643 RepID=A0AA36F190_OCTVU|nr:uncharacterized protein LOC115211049 [Octopus sinensis]CAI9720829.1 phosphatidylinositol-glycan biosynthesis class X protein [Octopus vulgaris]
MSLFGLFTPYKFNIKSSLFVFIGLIQILVVYANARCSLSVSLNKNGFHREMVYTVSIILPRYLSTTQCKSALEMTLPAGAYLDPNQINNLRKPEVLFDSPVDVEAPEHASSNQTLLVYTDLQPVTQNEFTAEIVLPVHLRYHQSEHSKPFKTIHFKTPDTIFIDCLDGMYTTYELQCSQTNYNICTWTKLKCQCRVSSTQAIIPVGNLDHLLIVAVITTLTTICGTTFLLYQLKSQFYKMN